MNADDVQPIIVMYAQKGPSVCPRLKAVLKTALGDRSCQIITDITKLPQGPRGSRILFAVEAGADGINTNYFQLLQWFRNDRSALEGCLGAVLIDGSNDLHTKKMGRELVLAANCSGCAFIGRSLVEGTGSLSNFDTQARSQKVDLYTAYCLAAADLVDRLMEYQPCRSATPKLAVFHASNRETSNTMALWGMVKQNLQDVSIKEVSLRNGVIEDCAGCPYETCLHFGEKGQCFYGGPIVEEAYPAILEADAIMMLCANYNDALSANITAFINRLTALFRAQRFYSKSLYALVVSGYSGGDILTEQLISALNMNKSFYLPPRFVMMVMANAPGSIKAVSGIEAQSASYALQIRRSLTIPSFPSPK